MLTRFTKIGRLGNIFLRAASSQSKSNLEVLDPYVPVWDPENDPFTNPHFGKEKCDIGLPDRMGQSVGPERLQLLMELYGVDDPIKEEDCGYVFSKKASKDHPNIFPSNGECNERFLLCGCESPKVQTQMIVGYTNRCGCGHYVRLMPYDQYEKEMNERIDKALKSLHGTPEYTNYHKELKAAYEKKQKIEDECAAIPNEISEEGQKKLDELYEVQTKIKSLRRGFFLGYVQQLL